MPFDKRAVLRVMAAYYAATAAWPLLDMRSFERVTGPKTDRWLVDTVAALILADALALAVGTRARRPSAETLVLAVADALAFIAVDVVFVAKRRIAPIYLADAAAELSLLLALAAAP
ncbi:MAG TPA: hypothetical protein VFB22_14750 [Candidatus Baltobacteraceae bacterium]|nr:hypothetical protein [Candidatus Baltobacteraceae bacterium]